MNNNTNKSFSIPNTKMTVEVRPDPDFRPISRYTQDALYVINSKGETIAKLAIAMELGKPLNGLTQISGAPIPTAAYPIIEELWAAKSVSLDLDCATCATEWHQDVDQGDEVACPMCGEDQTEDVEADYFSEAQ